jgi:hypothetical protein
MFGPIAHLAGSILDAILDLAKGLLRGFSGHRARWLIGERLHTMSTAPDWSGSLSTR